MIRFVVFLTQMLFALLFGEILLFCFFYKGNEILLNAVFVLFLSALMFFLIRFFYRYLTFTKKHQRIFAIFGLVFLGVFYSFSVSLIHENGGFSNLANWELTNMSLARAESSINKYIDSDGVCPNSLETLPGYPLDYIDYFSSTEILKYRKNENSCVVYSIGFDYVDSGGEVVLSGSAINEDFASSPLSYSIFQIFYKAKWFDESRSNGDIVRVIKLKSKYSGSNTLGHPQIKKT